MGLYGPIFAAASTLMVTTSCADRRLGVMMIERAINRVMIAFPAIWDSFKRCHFTPQSTQKKTQKPRIYVIFVFSFVPFVVNRHQKLYFNANCICRGVLNVLVTRPPEPVSIAVFGIAKLGVFVRLKASARNCNWLPSVMRNCLKTE